MIDRKMSEKSQGHNDQPAGRRLRAREKRARYIDEFGDEEDLFEGRKFDVEEKLNCERFEATYFNCVREVEAGDITLEFFQKNGFETPLLVKINTDNILGMKIPPDTFTVDDVKQCVGSRRILDVMNVETQKDDTMTMKEWCNYYNNKKRDCLLNVISLEFSHTKLEHYVDSPKIVKQMDWVDLVWPKHLKKMQKEGTNALQEMKYPKVQKYCLMSVKGCYTDFHIDFGGTSVWYHILRGKKVFWLIPPTEDNIQQYERWTLSGKQSDIFFADTVPNCSRVNLESGNTFFIPTGWIHAVYTKEDSLVFGGNFLHSFGIDKQLRVSTVEDVTKVPQKFRYPFYTELLWYVLVRYVHCLMGRNYLSVDDEGNSLIKTKSTNGVTMTATTKTEIKKEQPVVKDEIKDEIKFEDDEDTLVDGITLDSTKNGENEIKTSAESDTEEEKEEVEEEKKEKEKNVPFISFEPNTKVYLTKRETSGLQTIVRWLAGLSPSKRFIPELLVSPNDLLKDAQKMIDEHRGDDPELSVTGKPSLFWLTKQMLINFKYRTSIQKQQQKPKLPNGNNNNNNRILPTTTIKTGMFTNSSISASIISDSNQYKVKSGSTLKNDLIPSSFEGLIAQSSVKSGFNPALSSFRPSLLGVNTTSAVSGTESTTTTSVSSSSVTLPSFLNHQSLTNEKLPIHYNTVNQNYHSNLAPNSRLQTTGAVTRPIMSNLMYGYGVPKTNPSTINHNHHHHQNQSAAQSPQHNSFYQPTSPRHPPPPTPTPPIVSTTVVKMEHNYTQPSSFYQNPHNHHNYAYHPYQRIPASAAGGGAGVGGVGGHGTNYPAQTSQPSLQQHQQMALPARTIRPIIVNRPPPTTTTSLSQSQPIRPQTMPIKIVRPVLIRPTLAPSTSSTGSSIVSGIQSPYYHLQQQTQQHPVQIDHTYPNSSMMVARPIVVNPLGAQQGQTVVAFNGNSQQRLLQQTQVQAATSTSYPYYVSSSGPTQQHYIVTSSSHNPQYITNYTQQHQSQPQLSQSQSNGNIVSLNRTLPINQTPNSVPTQPQQQQQQQQQGFFYLNIAQNGNAPNGNRCQPMVQSPIIIKTSPAFSVANSYSGAQLQQQQPQQSIQSTAQLVQLSSGHNIGLPRMQAQQLQQHLLISNQASQPSAVYYQPQPTPPSGAATQNHFYAKAISSVATVGTTSTSTNVATLPRTQIHPSQIILTNSHLNHPQSQIAVTSAPSLSRPSPQSLPTAIAVSNYLPQYHYPQYNHSNYLNYQQSQPSLAVQQNSSLQLSQQQPQQQQYFVAASPNPNVSINSSGQQQQQLVYQQAQQQQQQQHLQQQYLSTPAHNYYSATNANYLHYQPQQQPQVQPPIPPPPPPTPLHHHHNPYHHPPPPPPTYLQHQPYPPHHHYSPYQIQTAPAAAYAYHTIPAYGPYIQAAPPPPHQHPQLSHPQSIQAHHHQHGVGYIPNTVQSNNVANSSTSIPAFISAMPPVVAPLASPTTLIAIQQQPSQQQQQLQPQMPQPVAQQPVTVVRSVPIMAPPPPPAHSHNSKPQQQQRPIAPGGGTNGNVSNNNNQHHQSGATSSSGAKSFSIDSSRRRRTRCKKCDSCLRADCGDCHFCKDMKKFGGPGRMKQSCIARQCLSPVLPHTACCVICGRDGWEKLTIDPALAPDDTSSSLMECSQCWEIVHPFCLNGKYPDLFKHNKGFMNKELPNSWECPKCVKSGNSTKIQPQSSMSSSSSTTSSSINRASSAVSTVSQSSSQAKSSSVVAHKSINWSLMTGAGASKPSKEVVSNSGNLLKRLKSTDDFPPPPPTSSSSDDEVTSKSSTTSMKKKMKSSSKKTSDSSGSSSSSKALFDKTCATVSQLSLHSSSSGGTSVANLNNNNNMASAASEVFPSYSQPSVSGIAQPMIAVTSSQQQPPLAQPGPSFMAPYHQPQYYHHHHHHQYHSGQNPPPPVLPLGPPQPLPPQSLPAPPPPQNYLSYPQPGYNQHGYDVPGSSTSGHPAQYAPPGSGVYHHPYQHPVPQITPRPLQPIPTHPTQNSQNYPPISGGLNSSATTRHPEPTLSFGKVNTSVVAPKKTESKSEIVELKMETEFKTEVKTEFGDNRPDNNNEIMQQQKVEKVDNLSDQEIRINCNGSTGSGGELTTFGVNGNSSIECTKEENKEQTAEKPGNNFKEIKKPMFVIRPAPLDGDVSDDTEEEEEEDNSSEESENENDDEDRDEDTATKQPKQSTIDRQRRKVRRRKIAHALKRFNRTFSENLAMEKDVILPILCRLKSRSDLLSCMAVCQSWNEWCCDPSLWKSLSLTQSKINSVILIGIVRRQPRFIDLSWCKLSKRQLFWLICRLPHLQSLKLAGIGSQVITALHSCHCPRLSTLDLSWSESLSDDLIRCLLSKAPDSRPGLLETKSRLRFMSEFSLAGTLITDDTLRLIVQNLSFIEKLDLSECEMITDSGISGLMIGATNLVELNLAGCRRISDTSLKLFQTSRTLRWFDVRHCQLVTVKACERFLAQTAKSSSSSTTSLVNNRNAHQHQGGGTWKMIEEKLFSKQQPK